MFSRRLIFNTLKIQLKPQTDYNVNMECLQVVKIPVQVKTFISLNCHNKNYKEGKLYQSFILLPNRAKHDSSTLIRLLARCEPRHPVDGHLLKKIVFFQMLSYKFNKLMPVLRGSLLY